MTLFKSLYTRAIQCSKSLWLKKYKKEVLALPDESAQAVFETGNTVGNLACKLFPDGKEVPYSKDYDKMIDRTQSYIDQGVPYIYGATISLRWFLVMVDVLHLKDNEVSIYEVKSGGLLRVGYFSNG